MEYASSSRKIAPYHRHNLNESRGSVCGAERMPTDGENAPCPLHLMNLACDCGQLALFRRSLCSRIDYLSGLEKKQIPRNRLDHEQRRTYLRQAHEMR